MSCIEDPAPEYFKTFQIISKSQAARNVGNITHELPVNLSLNSIPASVLNSMPADARPA